MPIWLVILIGILGGVAVGLQAPIAGAMGQRVGSTLMVVLIIIGQLGIGMIVDHFGLLGVISRPIDLTRLMGIAVLVFGAYLIAK